MRISHLFVVVACCAISGCVNRTYEYAYASGVTPTKFITRAGTDARTAPLNEHAIVLVPEGVWIHLSNPGAANTGNADANVETLARGPLRLFVVPGVHRVSGGLVSELDVQEGPVPSWQVNQLFARGEAYSLVVQEGPRQVDWHLLRVSPESYAALHRGDRLAPRFPVP